MAPFKKGSKEAKEYMAKLREMRLNGTQTKLSFGKPKKKSEFPIKPSTPKKRVTKQSGTSNKYLDMLKKAKPPGKRVTDTGYVYYENRKNRSDAKGKLTGIGSTNRMTKAQEIKRLMELANKSKSPLTKKVADIIKSKAYGYDNLQDTIMDIYQSGCQSGIIGELIYYSDTLKFYKKYQKEIIALLRNIMLEYGANNPQEVFGTKWDNDDFLIQETPNKNLLAWFGFEETTKELADQLGYEY